MLHLSDVLTSEWKKNPISALLTSNQRKAENKGFVNHRRENSKGCQNTGANLGVRRQSESQAVRLY